MNRHPNKLILLLAAALASFAGTAHAERADRDKPINIVSDRMTVDDAQHISTFEGKVDLTQGTLRVTAERIVVTEDEVGNKFCVATGRLATFRQKREGVNEYVEGYGERIEYDTRVESVDFYTRARVKREKDEVRGDHITYSTETEAFHVSGRSNSGRVRATIQPKKKDEPPVPADNNTPTNPQPDKP
jgi:lipopolysaccharide export system protein LptA